MTDRNSIAVQKVLGLDALTCFFAGALMSLAAGPIAGLTELPVDLLRWAGIALFPVAALFATMSRMRIIPQLLLWLAVIGNAAWVAGSIAVLAGFPANALGIAFVLAQAAVVAVLTVLEAHALGVAPAALA